MYWVREALLLVTQMLVQRTRPCFHWPLLLELQDLGAGQVLDGLVAEATVIVASAWVRSVEVVVRVCRASNRWRCLVRRGHPVLGRGGRGLCRHSIALI